MQLRRDNEKKKSENNEKSWERTHTSRCQNEMSLPIPCIYLSVLNTQIRAETTKLNAIEAFISILRCIFSVSFLIHQPKTNKNTTAIAIAIAVVCVIVVAGIDSLNFPLLLDSIHVYF